MKTTVLLRAMAWGAALALSAEERMKLAESARAHISTHYDIARMIERYEELYRGDPSKGADG